MNGRLRRPILSEAVRKYIKRYILDNNLEPGDLLPPESQLAEDLGVGRSSVREAMKSLQSLGIVEVHRGEGFVVREWNLDPVLETLVYGIQFNQAAFAELLQIRIWLESATIGDVLRQITPQDIDELDSIMHEWESRFDTDEGCADLDERFHNTLYWTLGNTTFTILLSVFWRAFETVEAKLIGMADIREEWQSHQIILDAIKLGDETLARERLIGSFHTLQNRLSSTK